MSMFDEEIKNKVWISVWDDKSKLTIEDFPYKTGIPKEEINGHCWKCITVNNCWFVDEKDKKPEEFEYTFDLVQKLLEILGLDTELGLYHPNCHCKKKKISPTNENNGKFEALDGKIDYFFKDKLNWYYSWGYTDSDKDLFVKTILDLTYKSFVRGLYEKVDHTNQGFKINVHIVFPGKNEKASHLYKVKTCWMIFPNGKLKCNTLIGGRIK